MTVYADKKNNLQVDIYLNCGRESFIVPHDNEIITQMNIYSLFKTSQYAINYTLKTALNEPYAVYTAYI